MACDERMSALTNLFPRRCGTSIAELHGGIQFHKDVIERHDRRHRRRRIVSAFGTQIDQPHDIRITPSQRANIR